MEASLSSNTRSSQQTVTSLKYRSAYDGFKKYTRKQKQPIQLQSFMSQLIVDNPIIYQAIHKQDLDHFDRLKKLNQMHTLDVGLNTLQQLDNGTSKFQSKTLNLHSSKAIRPYSSIHKSSYVSKQISCKVKQQANSFSKTIKSQDRSKNIKLKKSDILSSIQQRSAACLLKFIQNNQKKQIFEYVDLLLKQIQIKSKQDTTNLMIRCSKLEQQKSNLQRQILQTKFKIRTLERTNEQQAHKISEIIGQNHHIQSSYKSLSKFVQDYESIQQFQPGMGCKQLIAHYKKMQQLCLNKLNLGDDSKLKTAQHLIIQQKDQLSALKLRFEIVSKNMVTMNQELKERRQAQKQQDDNYHKLVETQKLLKQLQNRIVQFYNNWYQNRQTSIKQILKEIGCFKNDYSYIQMIDYMETDVKNLSTSSKVDEYLRRIVATIQLAQRKVLPNNVSSNKIDPCKVINDIVTYALSLKLGGKKEAKRIELADKENDDIKYLTQI